MAIVMLITIILDNNAAHDKFIYFSHMNVNVFYNTLTLKKSMYLYILQRAN